jgi:regulator of sigma E protease
MLTFIINLTAFLVAISFLVAFHEMGHALVARWLGVKVLRFSLGFGPVLWSRQRGRGIEFCLSAIPLGGYVKMLDEREGEVAPEERSQAFNVQPVWKRIAIVAAGPLTNFLLAILLFVAVFMGGIDGIAPIIIAVTPDSPASLAQIQPDDEIIALNGEPITTVMQLSRQMTKHLSEPSIKLTLARAGTEREAELPMPSLLKEEKANYFAEMGVKLGLPARVGHLVPGSPAEKAGLLPGDRITSVQSKAMPNWMDLVAYINEHPEEPLILGVQREGQSLNIHLTPQKNAEGKGSMGVYLDPSLLRHERLSFTRASSQAMAQTYQYALLTVKMIYFMISGQASLEHLSGPVSIAQIAGESAKIGFSYYLDFLAIISISLGVLNLLPIPALDGGHLLYYAIELLRRKPLSEAAQMIGFRFGVIILLSLMVVAFYNDILRLV